MAHTSFLRTTLVLLFLASLVDAAITLKLEKHHVDSRKLIQRSRAFHSHSNIVGPAPAPAPPAEHRSNRLKNRRLRQKRQDAETSDKTGWAKFVDLMASLTTASASTPTAESSTSPSTTSSLDPTAEESAQVVVLGHSTNSGPSQHGQEAESGPTGLTAAATNEPTMGSGVTNFVEPSQGPIPLETAHRLGSDNIPTSEHTTEPGLTPLNEPSPVYPTASAGSDIPDTGTVMINTLMYPTTTESATSSSEHTQPSASTPVSSFSPQSSQSSPSHSTSSVAPFDDDDGASIPLDNRYDVTYTIQMEVAGRTLSVIVSPTQGT